MPDNARLRTSAAGSTLVLVSPVETARRRRIRDSRHLPLLKAGRQQQQPEAVARLAARRAAAFSVSTKPVDEERVLDRYDLLYRHALWSQSVRREAALGARTLPALASHAL